MVDTFAQPHGRWSIMVLAVAVLLGCTACFTSAHASTRGPSGTPSSMSGMPMPPDRPIVAIPPTDRAADGVARVEVAARIDVALHWKTIHQYHFGPMTDTTSGGTASFVEPRGMMVTSPTSLKMNRQRLTVYAVNQAWHQAVGLKLPKDPYSRTRATGDPMLNAHLQSCYTPDNPGAECAVFITRVVRVYPYSASKRHPGYIATEFASAAGIAMLSVATPGKNATVDLSGAPKPGASWFALGWRVAPTSKTRPGTMRGVYSRRNTLADKDVQLLRKRLGTGLSGAVLLDHGGAVTGMLSPAGASAHVIAAALITSTLDRVGAHPARGSGDTNLATGLSLYGKAEYRHAAPWLRSAAANTSKGAVAVRYQETAQMRTGKSIDRSDAADAHVGHVASSGGRGPLVPAAAVGLALAMVTIALWWRRRRKKGGRYRASSGPAATTDKIGPPSPLHGGQGGVRPVPAMGRATALGSTPDPMRTTGPTTPAGAAAGRPEEVTRTSPTRGKAPETSPHGSAKAPAPMSSNSFCAQCGVQLAPGDRFCFACGARGRSHT